MLMMNRNVYTWITALFVLITQVVSAQQDSLFPLRGNAVLLQKSSAEDLSTQKIMGTSTGGDTLEVPFYEDFSYYGPYPSHSLWMNSNSVYVNNTYGKNPRTIGIATFDGLRSTGYPYKPYGSSGTENADTLTSKYIRLDS